MWRRIASWRTREDVPACPAPSSAGTAPDHEALARLGDALRSIYPDEVEAEEPLDDRLVALMLELSVEPLEAMPPAREKIFTSREPIAR